MSDGLGFKTILSCLDAGEQEAGLRPEGWEADKASGSEQRYFASVQAAWRPGLKFFDKKNLRAFATTSHSALLAKMSDWNMNLAQIPQGQPGSVYMISKHSEIVEWLATGKRVVRQGVDEFILTEGIQLMDVGDRGNYLVRARTKIGDTVYMYRCPEDLGGGFGILERIEDLERRMCPVYSDKWAGLQAPCVYALMEPSLRWILGLKNEEWYITYAQQLIRFGMNEKGFADLEETGLSMMRGGMKLPWVLSPDGQSFIFWTRREGVLFPPSMYQISTQDFKDPGDLNKIIE